MIRFELFEKDLIDAQDILTQNQKDLTLKEFMALIKELNQRGFYPNIKATPKTVELVFNAVPKKSLATRIKELFFPRKRLSMHYLTKIAYSGGEVND